LQEISEWEGTLRLGAFGLVFVSIAVLELWSPRLERAELVGAYKAKRWFTNLSLVVLSSVVLRIVLPVTALGAAIVAEQKQWGLFHQFDVDPVLAGVIAFVVLDFAVWVEHVASHKIPLLWRIHKMHHADTAFDVTTGLRFHPLEIVLSMLWKMAVVVALGAPVAAVLVFEVVLNATAMFNHSNLRLALGVDRLLRLVLVTPDMHRVHHSTLRRETDSNYGFNLPVWDRIFGTYVDQPQAGHDAMSIGLSDYRDDRPARLAWSLGLPFARQGRSRDDEQ
jgi:sterol desaturase/sphingolipid hydroxylase (fatty acid hydroxylase superfamily)